MIELMRLLEARRLTQNAAACRALREATGVSVTMLAASIGCSPAALSRWERGIRTPRPDLVVEWAARLRDLSPGGAAVSEYGRG